MVFNIQRWSLHDGPGIRTTLFFRGCPLRCRWCCNPESWAESASPDDILPETALEIIRRDAVFYRASGGGITFSGGEPFARPTLLGQLADAAFGAGIETAAETSGYFDFQTAAPILELLDHLFIDLKHMDDLKHRALTGISNRKILENIQQINATGKKFIIRIPLVRGLTDARADMESALRFCRSLDRLVRVELMPYHPLGEGKYKELNLPCDSGMAPPDKGRIDWILALYRDSGINADCSVPLYTSD